MFTHVVLFWLKPDAPEGAAKAIVADCYTLLKAVPTVRHLWAGTPAGTDRPVVDNSYAVGLNVVLDDRAGHDVYQSHPLHLEFIARHKSSWARVQVFDFK